MSTTILDLAHVAKTFVTGAEELHILTDVNLAVAAGETVVITGESGSGKSTLLNLIGGLDTPSSGTIEAAGYRVDSLPESQLTRYRSSVVGLVFQFHFLLKDFTALENVMMPAFMSGVTRDEATERARRLLTDVGLADRTDHFPTQLSGGERQRVAVARALVNDPDIILADEPTGNLDEGNSRTVENILFDLVREYGKTLLLVTHDVSLAERGEHHLHLVHGRVSTA
ncbi:MAG: ABC transporter ATP-binding protein [Spirochaetia bacterium]